MCDQGNYIDFESHVGEPLREAQKIGLDMPILKIIYEWWRMIQWRVKEAKRVVKVHSKRVLW